MLEGRGGSLAGVDGKRGWVLGLTFRRGHGHWSRVACLEGLEMKG